MSSNVCSEASDIVVSSSILDTEKNTIIGKYIMNIVRCYNVLASLPDLRPCLAVNKAFSELMAICIQIPEEPIIHAACIYLKDS